MRDAAGVCRALNMAGRHKIAIGEDGEIHAVSKQRVYPRSRKPDICTLSITLMWTSVGHQVQNGNVESVVISIGVDDFRMLRKNLSCVF